MHDYKINSVWSLKDVLFLSLLDSYFPVKKHQVEDVPTVAPAKIPRAYVAEEEKPSSDSKPEEAEKNKKKTDEEDRPNIRVNSTPRPRAVISSPDNDAVIGHKNRIKEEDRTALKNRTVQNRHTTRNHIFARSPVKTRKSNDEAECNIEIRGKKGSGPTVSSQRRRLRTERPSWQDP